MALIKLILIAAVLVAAQSRYVVVRLPDSYLDEEIVDQLSSFYDGELPEEQYGAVRIRRDAHGAISTNPDGGANVNVKLPIAGNDKNILSAIGGVSGHTADGKYGAATAGLALDNINGHGLTAAAKHIPGFGDQLTAAGRVNLLDSPDHKLNANAFVTKNMPTIPNIPDFNTHGANVDYLFKDKVGASFSAAQTPFLQRTDLSAMGNLNLFKNRDSTLDFNAGYSKTMSPHIPDRGWQPNLGLSFTRFW